MVERPRTVCVECQNHIDTENVSPEEPKDGAWFYHRCKAVERKKEYDPVTGGLIYGGDEKYTYCHFVNRGNCRHYEPRSNVSEGT